MSDDLDALVEWLDNLFAMLEEEGYHTRANTADFARKAITTLRTQLAEVSHMLTLSKLTTEAVLARAERAEAALAAQIEADAGIAEDAWLDGVPVAEISAAIRAQPHDRSALDRMLAEAREKVLREAADMFDADSNIAQTILALIEAPDGSR